MRDTAGYISIIKESNDPKIGAVDFFIESTYQDAKGEVRPCYLLTKKGCDMVANKTTGKKGVLFTAAYVTAFEAMRKHIEYENHDKPSDDIKQITAKAKLNNSRARAASVWLKVAALVDIPEYKQICASYASEELAGHEVLQLPKSEQRYYSATEIGNMFGISKNRVGKIANASGMKTHEYGMWFHDKSPYSVKEVDTFKYNDRAVEAFHGILGTAETA